MEKELLFDKNSAMYVIGHLMSNPGLIRNSDKYLLTLDDFCTPFYKVIFGAIANLSLNGANTIHPEDIEIYISSYNQQSAIFEQNQGLQFLTNLTQANVGQDESQFEFHYDYMKKFTVLRNLQQKGIDIKQFYDATADFFSMEEQRHKLEHISIPEIFDRIRINLLEIEKKNFKNEEEFLQTSDVGLRALRDSFKITPDVGPALGGEYFNAVCRGARAGKLYLISAPQSHGKTRIMMGNACQLALPRIEDGKLVNTENLQTVLYITTEQLTDEMQTLILAYVSGVNEAKILKNTTTPEEDILIDTALNVMDTYGKNLILDVLPNPSMQLIRAKILGPVLEKHVTSVFYDYIFIPTDENGMSSSHQYRTDQLLMLMSNQLKEIAAVYNIFIMTATQVSGSWQGPKIRNQILIRDSKAIADKVDVGMIQVICEDDEFACVSEYFNQLGLMRPNVVIDLYKNRRGDVQTCKIFRYFDYGTCRVKDLLMTTQSYRLIENPEVIKYAEQVPKDLLDFMTGGKANV